MPGWLAKAKARGIRVVLESEIASILLKDDDLIASPPAEAASSAKSRSSSQKKAAASPLAADISKAETSATMPAVETTRCAFIKGADFPAVEGGLQGLTAMLAAGNVRLVKSLSARVTHIIVSESWRKDLPANAAWVLKQQASGKTIIMENDVNAFLSSPSSSVGSKRRRESASGTPSIVPSPASKKARIEVSADPSPAEATPRAGQLVVNIPASSTDVVLTANLLQASGRTLKLQAGSQATISEVKAAAAAHESVPASDVRLILNGRELQDDSTLANSKVADGCSLLMSIRIDPSATPPINLPSRPAAPAPVQTSARDPNAYCASAPHFPDPVPGEQRGRPWRPYPSHDAQTRILRANTQRMFLVDRRSTTASGIGAAFDVLGSTGNIYTVTIARSVKCTCPDAARGNLPCKHVIFVLLKVLKVPSSNPLTWQVICTTLRYVPTCQRISPERAGELHEPRTRIHAGTCP
jgi:hypothetical protein